MLCEECMEFGWEKSSTRSSSETTGLKNPERERFTDKLQKASGIIISALGSCPLRVEAEVDDDAYRVLELLDAPYPSNRTVSRVVLRTKLYRMNYSGQDRSTYVDDYAELFR